MRRAFLLILSIFTALLFTACSEEPSTDSETHWASSMLSCENTSDCDDGLACLCGVCTQECASGEGACAELSDQAACATIDQSLPEQCQSQVAAGGGMCLEVCEADADCQARDEALSCIDGYCILEADETPTPQPTRPDANGTFAPVDGPPGLTVELVFDGVAYAYSSANAGEEARLDWRSDDGGLTWQPLGDSGLDALLDQASQAWLVDLDGARVLGTDQGLYRAEAGSETFEPIDHDLPGTLLDIKATSEAIVAEVEDENRARSLHRSDDLGESWSPLETLRTGVLGFETWNDIVFVRTHAGFEVSTDHGATFTAATMPPASFSGTSNWWAESDEALYIYYRSGASSDYKLGRSTDGVNWTEAALFNTPEGTLAAFHHIDGELYGLDQRGQLLRVPIDGGEVETLVDEPMAMGVVTELFAAADSLLLTGNGGTLRWTSGQTSYETIMAGVGHAARLEIVDGEVWAVSSRSVFHYADGNWQRVSPPADSFGWGDASFFEVGGELYVSDSTDCVFRRSGTSWETVFQWDSPGPVDGCTDDFGGFGNISDIVSVGDSIYVGQSGAYLTGSHNTGGTRPVEGGLVRFGAGMQGPQEISPAGVTFSHTPHILSIQHVDGELLVDVQDMPEQRVFVRKILRVDDNGWNDLTNSIIDEDGNAIEGATATELLDTDTGAYVRVRMAEGEASTRHARWDTDEASWRMLPELPGGETTTRNSYFAGAEVPYVAGGTEVYRLEDGAWQPVGTGLPDNKGVIRALEIDGPHLFVHLERGGVFKLEPSSN